MAGLWIAVAFVFWYGVSLYLSEVYGKSTRLGRQWLFAISFVLSPLAGVVAIILSKKPGS
jgi:uncharacterized membrane protein